MAEEDKALEKVGEVGLPIEEASLYQSFVQEVVTRKFQQKHGDPVGRHATCWIGKPKPGSVAERAIYCLGDPDVVQEIGDALETEYDYHGLSPQAISKEREAEVVGEELVKLYEGVNKEAPYVLPALGDALERMRRARLPEAKEVGEAALGLDEALAAFEPRFNESEGKEGS